MCDGDVTRVARWYDLDVSNSSEASAWTVGQNKVVYFPKETLQHRDLRLVEELGSSKIGQGCLSDEEDRILFEACDLLRVAFFRRSRSSVVRGGGGGALFRTSSQFAFFAWRCLLDLVLFLVVVLFLFLPFGLLVDEWEAGDREMEISLSTTSCRCLLGQIACK